VFGVIYLLVIVVTTIWVGVDASKHNFRGGGFFCKTTAGWVIGCLLLWIVTFPVYLWQRRRAPSADSVPLSLNMASAGGAWYRKCPQCAAAMAADARFCASCGQSAVI
jgi:hypothetical protein